MINIHIRVDETKPEGEEILIETIIKDSSYIENSLTVRELMKAINELLGIDYDNMTISLDGQ